MKKIIILTSLVIIVLFFSKFSFAGETKWVDIQKQESEILIGDTFIVNAKNLTYQNESNAKNNTLWNWAYSPSGSTIVNISWYRLQKGWMVYDRNVYLPKKQINWLVGKGLYKWNGKRKGFKSHKHLSNFRPFILKESGDYCFIFGVHFSDNNINYKEKGAPFAVLEGYICRPSKDFSESEIHNYINNVGVRDLREL